MSLIKSFKHAFGINPGIGRRVKFHGAFDTKREAKRKERSIGGSGIIKRKIKRQTRFVVVSKR